MPYQNDPENYRALSVPFADADEANAALKAFTEEVGELRKKHRIANVVLITQVSAKDGEDESTLATTAHFGDSLRSVGMCAYAYGQAQRDHQAMIARLLK